MLTTHVNEHETKTALKDIGDLKALRVDGYGAKFFKTNWSIIKDDLIAAIKELCKGKNLYRAFNNIVVTLISKHFEVKNIKDYKHITDCTTFYKIISKILTARLGGVLGSIINQCQAAFVPGQKIHNRIMLAFELLKGYSRKGGTPRCIIQLDLQKAYDMMD